MMKTPRLAGFLALAKAEKEEENEVTYDYDALTPSLMDEEDAQHYIGALNFACHKHDIKNIAVTGPYGAGKSSVLLTWSKHSREDLQIMTVSLADFDMVRATTETENNPAETDIKSEKRAKQQEKSIEYSILQQILYKARKSELPYSRIERIADVTPYQTFKMALELLATLGFGICGLVFLFPEYFRDKLSLTNAFSEFILDIPSVLRIGILAGGAFFVSFYLLLSKLHRMGIFDRRVSIEKIDISKGATISTRPSDPSLLNVFIDEIVYFFEKQKYNVVIFEDLDRHNDGAIFIKLREINQIINNSRPELNPVRFIYAVRDDIFNSPEARTKFFDFVIPVIPVMDSQNATEHFSSKFTEDEMNTSDFQQCVARLAIFIPDMRVLNSIANEFRLYRNLVNNGENIVRLLSLIAYKNLCARDYHLIDSKSGILYGVMNAHISGEIFSFFEAEISEEIDKLNHEVSEIKNELERDKSGLIGKILQVYISDKTKKQLHFSNNNGATFDLDQVISDEDLFISMLETSGLFVRTIRHGANLANISSSEADDILSEYKKRCELLHSKSDGKLSSLEKKTQQLLLQRRRLQVSSPGSLVQRMGSNGFRHWVSENLGISSDPDRVGGYDASQLDFIYSLLRWEYLSSDYMAYRSVFIPGSLSSGDNDFIRAVSLGKEAAFTGRMTLEKTENVISKLKEIGLLLQENAWHPCILHYLLQHDNAQLRIIMRLQAEQGEQQRLTQLTGLIFETWSVEDRIRYVHQMLVSVENLPSFTYYLSEISDKNAALQLLLLLMCFKNLWIHHDSQDLLHLIKQTFSRFDDVPERIPEGYADIFSDNIRRGGITIDSIGSEHTAQGREVIRKIVGFNLWRYSSQNLRDLYDMFCDEGNLKKEYLDVKPLSAIDALMVQGVSQTVKNNIDQFIKDFFISSREVDRVVEVLNNANVSIGTACEVIRKMEFSIEELKFITERGGVVSTFNGLEHLSTLYTLLLENDRIAPSWHNISYLLEMNDDFAPWFALWFDRNHAHITDIPPALSSLNMYPLLIDKIYASGALNDAARRKILSAVQMTLLALPENLTADQAALMIEYRRLAPVPDVYKQLDKVYSDADNSEVPLLAGLVLQHPALLNNDPGAILYKGGEFNYPLVKKLLKSNDLPEFTLAHTLHWLWEYEQEMFDGPLFISSDSLLRLLTFGRNESMLRALLVQLLRAGAITHDLIARTIRSFGDPVSEAFISDLKHKSIDLTEDELELAVLLESAGFIRSLNQEKKEGRYRFIPHYSQAFRHA